MKRDIYVLHGHGLIGVTKIVFDDDTPGDIVLVIGGSQVYQAEQVHIEETNVDPLDVHTMQARKAYKAAVIPIQKLQQGSQQTTEEFFRELWGDEVYDTEALSRDW